MDLPVLGLVHDLSAFDSPVDHEHIPAWVIVLLVESNGLSSPAPVEPRNMKIAISSSGMCLKMRSCSDPVIHTGGFLRIW